MDGWFLLSIGVSLAVSFTFLILVTDELRAQVKEVGRRMDMLLGALEDCQLAHLTRNAQGKIVEIAIKGETIRIRDNDTGQQ